MHQELDEITILHAFHARKIGQGRRALVERDNLEVHEACRLNESARHFFAGYFHDTLGDIEVAAIGVNGTECFLINRRTAGAVMEDIAVACAFTIKLSDLIVVDRIPDKGQQRPAIWTVGEEVDSLGVDMGAEARRVKGVCPFFHGPVLGHVKQINGLRPAHDFIANHLPFFQFESLAVVWLQDYFVDEFQLTGP